MTYREGEKPSVESVWVQVWIAVASSSNSTHSDSATRWADKCVEEYKKRFEKEV